MYEIARTAEKRLNDLERESADQFESSIVHNRVWEAIREDDRLRHTLDVTERAYELEERNDLPDEMERVPFGAAEDLNEHIDTLVDMVIARECAAVIEDAWGDWFDESDHHDEDDVRDAVVEAASWLAGHRDAAAAEGIDVEEVWDEHDSDEVEEVPADV